MSPARAPRRTHAMRSLWRAVRRGLHRDDGGAVTLLVALAMTTIIGSTAMSVDLGRVIDENRHLQAIADVVALDAAKMLDGHPAADVYPAVAAEAAAAAARNHYPSTNGLLVEVGTYALDAAGNGHFTAVAPTDPATVPNAVRVTPSDTLGMVLHVGPDLNLSRKAAAARVLAPGFRCAPNSPSCPPSITCAPPAAGCPTVSPLEWATSGYTIGSFLAGWDTSGLTGQLASGYDDAIVQTGVIDALMAAAQIIPPLQPLAQTAGQVPPLPAASGRAVGYQGLATTTLKLGDLVAADPTLGTVSQLLTTQVSLKKVLNAEAGALANDGVSAVTAVINGQPVPQPASKLGAAITLLQSLAASTSASQTTLLCDSIALADPNTTGSSSTCQLDQQVAAASGPASASSGSGSVADAVINGLDLLQQAGLDAGASGAIANGQHLVDLSSVFPGITATLRLISPAVIVPDAAVTSPPTRVRTAQLNVDLNVNAPVSSSAPTPLPAAPASVQGQVTFPLHVEGGSATGALSAINCKDSPVKSVITTATNAFALGGGPAQVVLNGGAAVPVGTAAVVGSSAVGGTGVGVGGAGPQDLAGQVLETLTLSGPVSAPSVADVVSATFANVNPLLPDGTPAAAVESAITAATTQLNRYLRSAVAGLSVTIAGADVTINSITCGATVLVNAA